jgi:hypothetical protein
MPDIFTVNSADATAIQQHYEEVIEVLLRTLLDAKEESNGLKIFDDGRLVYGRDSSNQFRDVDAPNDVASQRVVSELSGQFLNPQLIAEIQQLHSTPVGEVVKGAVNKRVEVDGQVILQSDDDGKVTVNPLFQPEIIQNTTYQKPVDTNQVKYSNFLLKDANAPGTEVQKDENLSSNPGSIRVIESLKKLENTPLTSLLNAEIEQLQAEIKTLQQEQSLYQELIKHRLQQPQNTSWWQQTINNISVILGSVTSTVKMAVQEFKQYSTQHQAAASFKTLFHLYTQPGINEYQGVNYQISRDGSLYEVKQSVTGKLLMQFRSTPLGVSVETSNLERVHIREGETLHRSLQKNEPLPTSFAPVGKQEAEYFARVKNVINALIQYAVTKQTEVEIDGVFSYKWQANPDGKVSIDAKDGRGNLLEKIGEQLRSNMSERDLIYFEQMLPKLQPKNKQQLSQHQKFVSSGLER